MRLKLTDPTNSAHWKPPAKQEISQKGFGRDKVGILKLTCSQSLPAIPITPPKLWEILLESSFLDTVLIDLVISFLII